MEDKTIEIIRSLLDSLGIPLVWVVVAIVVWKIIMNPAYLKYLEFKLEKAKNRDKGSVDLQVEMAKIREKSITDLHLELTKINEKSSADLKEKVFSKRLEIQTVKINRVLPILEEISGIISEHMLMHNTYLYCILNRGSFKGENRDEKSRVKLDEKMIELIYKVSIYLPPGFRMLLGKLRMIISCSWQDTIILNEQLGNSDFAIKEVIERDIQIYTSYRECFYDMVFQYCMIEDESINYLDILDRHNFNEDAIIKDMNLMDKFICMYLLLREYDLGFDRNEVANAAFASYEKASCLAVKLAVNQSTKRDYSRQKQANENQ